MKKIYATFCYLNILYPHLFLTQFSNVCLLSRWTYNDPLRTKYNAKMAGMNAPIAKPKGSKKFKDWEPR